MRLKLFNAAQIDKINQVAERAKDSVQSPKKVNTKNITSDLNRISAQVQEYFKDSEAILIHNREELHEYVTNLIKSGYAGIDTETTGLDRQHDTIVGSSLYYPGGVECYIPNNHLAPIFDQPYKGQLTYEDVHDEFQRIVESNVKLIFANADFDLAMIRKDYKVNLVDRFYYDVIIGWRVIREGEQHYDLKNLYNRHVLKGKGDPKRFSDFFPVQLFPYCKPEVAKLYAAHDAKITFEEFKFQLPYITKSNKKCTSNNLERIADLVWDIEMPMVRVCHELFHNGIYIDKDIGKMLQTKYHSKRDEEMKKLKEMVQKVVDEKGYAVTSSTRKPFTSGAEFNPTSPMHVKYLVYTLMGFPEGTGKDKGSTRKEKLEEFHDPLVDQILKVRSYSTLINTFVDKMPNTTGLDGRIHARFNQVGADTGRMCIAKGTKITCLNSQKNIEDIVPGDIVYCYDVLTHKLMLSKVKNLWPTGKDRPCVRIKWQSSGKGDIGELICTPEHMIMKKSGEWCRADKLKRYDKVAHLRRTPGHPKEPRPCLYGWDGMFTREQDIIKEQIFNCSDTSMCIHHVDQNVSNNDISNLQLLTVSEHLSKHGNDRYNEGQIKYEHLYSPESIRKRKETGHRKYVDRVIASKNDLLNQIKECKGRISYLPCDYITFKRRCEIAGIDIEKECAKYNPRYHKKRIEKEEFMHIYQMHSGLAIRVIEHFNISYDKFYKYCDEYGISRNHMIQSVTPCGFYDVYDIEVEGYHNFIAGELCVHNSSSEPNLQNIPSHANDIRHMFKASPGYVMMSSDYSQQEPKLTAFVSQDKNMFDAFTHGRDIYATIASIGFDVPYENCLEFHPETHEYQPEGKAKRGEAKTILLGILYGRSINTIAEQLYGNRNDMTDDQKLKAAQKVYDSVMNGFPSLRNAMLAAQDSARTKGYTETILGRRRHLPDMQLPKFEFRAMPGYVNPDVDPMDISTLDKKDDIPVRIQRSLLKEFDGYKYYSQIVKRTKELAEEHIKVINNNRKITDATRQCLNGVIQGSAADMTKMALLNIYDSEEWRKLGGRVLIPIHDEILCEFPKENYEEGAKLLSKLMSDAGDFLPFPINCDVEITTNWYGLEYPCPYPQPKGEIKDIVDENEIKWLQYMLYSREYVLPTHKDLFGDQFRGDVAKGVDGVWSDELSRYIEDYKRRWSIVTDEEFIEQIKVHVIDGITPYDQIMLNGSTND